MDFWIIGNKLSLLAFICYTAYYLPSTTNPESLLVALLILCLTVATPIFKHIRYRQALTLATIALILIGAFQINTVFMLLLPASLFELVALIKRNNVALPALLTALSLIWVPIDETPLYILTACLSLLLLTGVRSATARVDHLEVELDKLHLDKQKLSSKLHEQDEYTQQSAYTIKLEERNRLSQQIHDDIGHAMAGALIQMEASRMLTTANPDRASELLHNAINISKEGLERIRLTLKDIKPRSEELGINRLRLMVDELSTKQPIQATLGYEGDLEIITPLQWKIIQDNASEAITNALKYAQATHIHVEITVLNKFVKTAVKDNGIGIAKMVKGLGIVGMEERAATIGGTVIVDGSKGFSVTTLLPLDAR
ncbi:MAG: histidine kinase [Candidatus Cohnella colombiensis]|uniref:histidine kinase n=1 Tax=Candidatus Cohnella colombiensis TaxID=3121368 RepID=A0AA95JBV1_9BACL|nr:MAG: histidine kinase [Cohnella sp.]